MPFPGPLPIRSLVVGVVSISLVLASCSGGGNGANGSATTAVPGQAPAGGPDTRPAGPATPPGPDDARLQAVVLASADLPAGYTGHPSASTDSTRAETALNLAQCLGRRNIDVDLVAGVVSQDFSKGRTTIASSAKSYLFDDDVAAATASYSNPKFASCYQQLISAAGLGAGAIQNLAVKVTPGAGGGPANVAAIATITGTLGGGAAAAVTTTTAAKTGKTTKTTRRAVTTTVKGSGFIATIVFISGPRVTAELDFFGVGDEVPASVRADLIAKVAARAAKG